MGLAAGNTFVFSFGRAVFLGIVFALMGTGLIILLRKYVPELFEITVNADAAAERPVSVPDADINAGSSFSAGVTAGEGSSAGVSSFDAPAGDSGEQGFVPLGDYVADKQYGDEHLQTKGNEKLGKHKLQEKGMKFEPKIIAEAIRTMMNKDQ